MCARFVYIGYDIVLCSMLDMRYIVAEAAVRSYLNSCIYITFYFTT